MARQMTRSGEKEKSNTHPRPPYIYPPTLEARDTRQQATSRRFVILSFHISSDSGRNTLFEMPRGASHFRDTRLCARVLV